MKLTVNDTVYEVDMAPLKARAAEGIQAMIDKKDDQSMILRQAVKAACQMAMPTLGIVKKDRNDDPIQLVAGRVAEMIFEGIEKHGLEVKGTIVPEPPKGAEADGNTN